jgi:hypothetical protein
VSPIRKERRAKNDLDFSPTTGRRIRRKTANVVDTIKTQARSDTQEKKRLVRSLLHHPELRDAFEEECATSRSAAEIAMDNLAANIKATSSRTREGRVARDSMRASVCPGTAKFPGVNKVAKRLNVDRKAMSRSNARMKDVKDTGEWASIFARRMHRKCQKTPQATIDIVQNWWFKNTTVLNRHGKDVVRKRVHVGKYVHHKKHVFTRSMWEMHMQFKEDHPEVKKAKFDNFRKLKPYFCKKLRERNVCLSKEDCEIEHMFADVCKMRGLWLKKSEVVDLCDCSSGASLCIRSWPSTMHELVNLVLCERPEGERWHGIKCYVGDCDLCGVSRLLQCKAMKSAAQAHWREFFRYNDATLEKSVVREHGMSQRPPIVREKDNRDTTGAEMMASFAQKLEKWIGFDFIGRWQMKHIKGAYTSIHLRMRCPCVHVYRSNEQPTTECSCLQL